MVVEPAAAVAAAAPDTDAGAELVAGRFEDATESENIHTHIQ